MSNASNDSFVENLEEVFGWEGYGRWFKLLEIIATKMDKSTDCYAEHSWVKWQSLLKGKRNKLNSFLVHCQNEGKIKVEQNGNILRIVCPKLLELRDEHTRNSGVAQERTPEQLPPKNQDQETDLKIKNHNHGKNDSFNIKRFFDNDENALKVAKKAVPGKDVYYYFPIYDKFMVGKPVPDNPIGSFINWFKSYVKKEAF